MEYIIMFVVGAVLGFVLAAWVYRNNTKKVNDLVDSIDSIKDQIKDIKK